MSFAHAPKPGASGRARATDRTFDRAELGGILGKNVLVIGAGIVGCSAALWLQRDGHQVTIVDKKGPGEGASFGNASVIATESCIPVATPGILWDVPKYLSDPLGPLAIRWSYLPKLAPWLWRFVRSSGEATVEQISIALRTLLVEALAAHKELAAAAGCRDIIQDTGWLGIYRERREVPGVAMGSRTAAPPRRQDRDPEGRGDPAVRAEPAADLQARRLLPGEFLRPRQLPPGAHAGRGRDAQRRRAW